MGAWEGKKKVGRNLLYNLQEQYKRHVTNSLVTYISIIYLLQKKFSSLTRIYSTCMPPNNLYQRSCKTISLSLVFNCLFYNQNNPYSKGGTWPKSFSVQILLWQDRCACAWAIDKSKICT